MACVLPCCTPSCFAAVQDVAAWLLLDVSQIRACNNVLHLLSLGLPLRAQSAQKSGSKNMLTVEHFLLVSQNTPHCQSSSVTHLPTSYQRHTATPRKTHISLQSSHPPACHTNMASSAPHNTAEAFQCDLRPCEHQVLCDMGMPVQFVYSHSHRHKVHKTTYTTLRHSYTFVSYTGGRTFV